jgi:hypothetical protein
LLTFSKIAELELLPSPEVTSSPCPCLEPMPVAVGAAKIPALHSLISEISDADALSLSLSARSFELPGFLCSWLVMVVAEA